MAVIAGNWKMHMGPAETRAFFSDFTLDGVGARPIAPFCERR